MLIRCPLRWPGSGPPRPQGIRGRTRGVPQHPQPCCPAHPGLTPARTPRGGGLTRTPPCWHTLGLDSGLRAEENKGLWCKAPGPWRSVPAACAKTQCVPYNLRCSPTLQHVTEPPHSTCEGLEVSSPAVSSVAEPPLNPGFGRPPPRPTRKAAGLEMSYCLLFLAFYRRRDAFPWETP